MAEERYDEFTVDRSQTITITERTIGDGWELQHTVSCACVSEYLQPADRLRSVPMDSVLKVTRISCEET